MAQNHYADLSSKGFYPGLCKFFSSGPIVCMCWEGKVSILGRKCILFLKTLRGFHFLISKTNVIFHISQTFSSKDVIRQGRQMLGETQPLASKPGSIRGDFSIDLGRNICHGSDSPDSAAHELKMWFPEGVNDWAKTVDSSVYE